ncbi:Trk system potassium transporter TrkA [Selenomonas sp. TAMA-11512]|uniref:Trk system potassium transporter TrkA n=1 Tax=Selenomonas sp. TAMA-11512 TaxID=3095337 RepID=UPI003084FE1D|nr:Trk system potassium transporter TrkA [Selenomonas sp. TAMA-11512]
MKVVIVGAGKMGYTIASLLSNEDFDVILVDMDADRLEAAKHTLDVLTITASGTNPGLFEDPDIKGADLLIASTLSDETNMVICTFAKKSGITHTIARIRDIEFVTEGGVFVKEMFGIDQMLNPELITAQEAYRILMTPAALDVEDFADGKVRLYETRVKKESPYIGIPFKDLRLPEGVLAGIIFRDHRLIIPHGSDSLQHRDNAYFIGTSEAIKSFSSNFVQRNARKLKRVMIIGAGRTGRALAKMLDMAGVEVKIFDTDRDRCRAVSEKLTHGMAICGDGTDMDLLTEEGIEAADVVVALTDDDKLNLMLALLSKHLGADKTAVRVTRSEYVELMKKVGVDIVLSSRLLAASEALAFARRGGVVQVSFLEGAKAEAVEVIVGEGAPVAGVPLMAARLPKECLVCAYVRGAEVTIPNGATVLIPGDRAVLFIDTKCSQQVMKYFKGRESA